jgi:hypothetical protein
MTINSSVPPVESENTTPVPTVSSVTGSPTPTSGQAAANVAAAGGGIGSVSTLAQLQSQAPQVYKAMVMGIAIQICNTSQNFQNQINDMYQEMISEDNS